MIKKIFILLKIARKIGKSNIISIIENTQQVPLGIKLFFSLVLNANATQIRDLSISSEC